MITQTPIKNAAPSHVDQAIQTVLLAFSSDPVMRWMFPEPHRYLAGFPEFLRALAGKAFDHDTAYYVEGFSGAALWLPPGVHPDEEALEKVAQRAVSERAREDLNGIIEQLDRSHPREPHWYLPFLGVDPAYQRRGYGAALLRHALARCDRDGLPAYLESSNAENISLYRRHGFEVLREIQVGNAPPLYPMLRQPQ